MAVRVAGKALRSAVVDGGFLLICGLEALIARFSPVGNANLFRSEQFEWVERLESNWTVIRRELDDLMQHHSELPNFQDISADQYRFTTDDKWKTYFLYCFGMISNRNCARCPETTKLIESIPNMQTAFFSILSPHKHIPRHRGIYKGLIRYHLGLIVPEPTSDCRMSVGDSMVHWQEGKSVIFDDTYPHEVWNDTDAVRVVLLIDFIRPFVFPFSAINRFVIGLVRRSPFVQDGVQKELDWEAKFHDTPAAP